MIKQQRELGLKADGSIAMEPYCGHCEIDIVGGKSFCVCGHSFEDRKASGWKLNGFRQQADAKLDDMLKAVDSALQNSGYQRVA